MRKARINARIVAGAGHRPRQEDQGVALSFEIPRVTRRAIVRSRISFPRFAVVVNQKLTARVSDDWAMSASVGSSKSSSSGVASTTELGEVGINAAFEGQMAPARMTSPLGSGSKMISSENRSMVLIRYRIPVVGRDPRRIANMRLPGEAVFCSRRGYPLIELPTRRRGSSTSDRCSASFFSCGINDRSSIVLHGILCQNMLIFYSHILELKQGERFTIHMAHDWYTTYGLRTMWTNFASGKRRSRCGIRPVLFGLFRTRGRPPLSRVALRRTPDRPVPSEPVLAASAPAS